MTHDQEIASLSDALAYLKPHEANNGTISLRAAKARHAVEVIEAEIAALRSKDREDGARPSEPPPGLLMSMAIRYDHAIGMPGYYEWKTIPGLGTREPVRHARILSNRLGTMRKIWEEVSDQGFYSPEREAEYIAWAERCGVTFGENGRPRPLPLRPAQEGDEPGRSALTDTAQSGREGADG
ncbi:hypothetical protein [Methylobacterium sp. Leaf118]|uniref:hypothetical protein n=1 Tax=Methylobacterium sp. Leaf118 TaxID=2876562 RepID=UPI001E412C27|nr:hypothetical protein [Methylobacterium sp. Leaf118]